MRVHNDLYHGRQRNLSIFERILWYRTKYSHSWPIYRSSYAVSTIVMSYVASRSTLARSEETGVMPLKSFAELWPNWINISKSLAWRFMLLKSFAFYDRALSSADRPAHSRLPRTSESHFSSESALSLTNESAVRCGPCAGQKEPTSK
jgi:hypothetical protein